MLKNLLPKRRSIIFTWALSYAVLLAVPMLISAFTYVITASVLENEINQSNTLLLKKVQQGMDDLLYEAQKLSHECAFNPRVNELLKAQGSADKWTSYDIYKAASDLKVYNLPNSSINDYYVYFQDMDTVLCPAGSYDSKSFYEIYAVDWGIPYAEWQKLMQGFYRGDYKALRSREGSRNNAKTILFLLTIPFMDQSGPSANIVVRLDEAKFLQDAGDIQLLNKGTVAILDKSNNIIAASNPLDSQRELKYAEFKGNGGGVRGTLEGKKVIISYITSQAAQWKYITIVPESVFWEKADYVRRLTVINLLLCLLICGGITYYLLKKNYNPVGKLIKLLENYHGMNYDKKHSEYSFIEQAIDKAHSDKQAYDKILMQQNKVLRADFLKRLLKGRESHKMLVKDKLLLYDMALKSDYFAVMAFYIEDFSRILPGNEDESSESAAVENYKLVQFVLSNVVEDLVGQRNQGFMTDVDDMMVCLVNFDEAGVGEAKAETSRVAEEARKFLGQHYKINFMVSISNVHKTLAGIPDAYSEAMQAMEYKKLLGIDQVIHFEDIIGLPKGNYYYPLEKEQQLINCIKVGDYENSKIILEEIFQKNFEGAILSVEIARCLMFNLVSTMLKTIDEINYEGNDDFLEGLSPVNRLLSCRNVNEMKNEMVKILKIFCQYIKNRNKAKCKSMEVQLKDRILQLVQDNYFDANLGITTIADRFDVNPVYLSKIFREQTGEGLLDYINKVRLNKAKQLFKEQRGNLDDIAKTVGYSSTRTFTRAFKKYEGVTPGKFKELV